MCKELLFLLVFCVGELLFNKLWFNYLKHYFGFNESKEVATESKKILFLDLSIFKGVLERLILTVGLLLGFPTVLIVFGTLKLGTRFKEQQEIKTITF